jgi:hypothetical protein
VRQPRNFDAELKALDDKARDLKERKLRQLGELVVATGADALRVEELAGVLLAAVASTDKAAKQECRQRGAAFFRKPARTPARSADVGEGGHRTGGDGPQPAAREAGAA